MQYRNIKEFLRDEDSPIIDVRSPSEFDQGHIPGSINIPLFDNYERAEVGVMYKQRGKEPAVKEGLKIVGPKMVSILEQAENINPGKHLRVYCWRGGMRSSSMAWLFETGGYDCTVLNEGYKSYRRLGVALFEDLEIILIGGETGSGKTEILAELEKAGEQIVDLEGLANHKGSAFGAVGMPPQPTNEQFQNLVIERFLLLDRTRRVFVEDESSHIGKVSLPEALWLKMKSSPLLYLSIPLENRIARLVKDYGQHEKSELESCIRKIERKLGGQNMNSAINFLEENDMASVAKLMLYYYDKSYRFLLDRKKNNIIGIVESNDPSPTGISEMILRKINSLEVANPPG